ncbi:hypothetical protein FACS1894155_02460 [Bacteroidia bacterium]|nr:hypothetical protein FACS1894155_02460 [Bacteroidia bacterium]
MNEKLNFHDLVGLLSEKAGITKKDAENFLREFFDLTTNALLEDKQVKIKNLGTFKIVDVHKRESVDVRTGERVVIPPHSKVNFIPDTNLSKTINEPFAMFDPIEIRSGELNSPDIIPDTAHVPPEHNRILEKRKKKRKRIKFLYPVIAIIAILVFAIIYFIPDYVEIYKKSDDYVSETNHEQGNETPEQEIDITEMEQPSTESKTDNISEDSTSIVNNPEIAVGTPVKPEKQPETTVEKTVKNTERYSIVNGIKKRKIVEGERLTLIALQEYGNKDFWIYLYEENKNMIKNPENVMPGMIIIIPPVSKYSIDKDNPESVKKAKELQQSLK